MIKINLLPTRTSKKKRIAAGGGQAFLVLAILLLAAEGAALYFLWYQAKQDELAGANKASQDLQTKVQSLQKVKQQIADDEAQQKLLEEQNQILERLKDGKTGPPNMLTFLTYTLTDPPDTLANQDELKAVQKAGWNLQWDADSVWVTHLEEDEYGTLAIEGEARSHEDVAEFYQRLRSSIYFKNVEPGPQERKYDQGIEMKYIAFKGQAELNYRLPGVAPAEGEGEDAEGVDGGAGGSDGGTKDTMIVPGRPSIEAVPGAAGAIEPKHQAP